ncbi:Uncharacterised protein [Streptococcus pneumoniae]|nr:Uncharacterised protein [Streptococcus pneumoniae]
MMEKSYGGIGKKKLEKGGKTFIMDLYLFKPRQRRLGLYMLDFVSSIHNLKVHNLKTLF